MPTVAYFGNRFEEFRLAAGRLELIKTDCLPPLNSVDVIVIDAEPIKSTKVPIGSIGVVHSDNKIGLQVLMQSGVRTVTCGMSYRDTVTLSSNMDRLTVCLQRRIPTVGGGLREPAEFTVETGSRDVDCLLLASAVRLLCGKEPE